MPFDDGALVRPPAVHLDAGYRTAARLRDAGRAAAAAARTLDATAAPSWAGAASVAATQGRVRLAARVGTVASVCSSFAAAVEVFLDEVGSLLPQWRYAVEEWQQLEVIAAGVPDVTGWRAEAVAAQERAHRCAARYEQAVWVLSAATDVAVEGLDVDRTWQDHLGEGLGQAAHLMIAQPFTDALYLGLGWTTDRQGWWDTVRAVPGSTWDALTHPRRTAGELLGEEHWRNGDWGLGLGTALSVVVLTRKVPRVPATARRRFPDAAWDPSRPEPRVQSVDEMLAGVDLDAHESGALGHSLRRHVVSDDYLRDRVTNGTIREDWMRGPSPGSASAWTDRGTAESGITDALRANERQVRDFAAGTTNDGRIEFDAGHVVGRTVYRENPALDPVGQQLLTVQLGRRSDGTVYIVTAFPGLRN